ncbi:MAG: glycosyltransferase [Microcystis aeruginosa Ma_QC_Ca_00000000_S207]|uniref:Glycosyltransferase n=1 Tax=Microcystis aeruginosa Ma_QC_Ca_00000000_S207 TaxID=2486251 RepID=A0A552F9Y1_MICAE|nr:MAG: glycosyltransferase [Microcystis aeruginosa Ma_QC_Ca_00000000_S207]
MTKKIKVGFYVQNEGYPNVDCRFPELGNPGLGGTQFSEIATAYYLNKFYPDRLEILLLANITELLPPSLQFCQIVDAVDAAAKSEVEGCDIFIFRSSFLTQDLYEKLCILKVKTIARSDNFPTIEELKRMVDCPQIKCHVCVGQEELDMYRDHRIFEKSTRIFHPFNIETYASKNDIIKQRNTVVYLGSLDPAKQFHVLARVWSHILAKKPEAKLIVIGSGKVYNRNQKLGKWGVAEETYEANYIRPFLSDENGDVIKSVHFSGLLGAEKTEILQTADVGVVSPTGSTETFCISGVEIQACGTPVVSAAKGGLLDTVVHGKTGLLGRSDRDLIRNILYLLDNPDVARQFGQNGINFVREKFDYRLIIKEWLELFIDVYNNRPAKPQPMKPNYLYQAKFLREGMRIIKKNIPLLRGVPSLVEIKSQIKEILTKILKF